MKVQLLFFGIATDLVGENSVELQLNEPKLLQDFKKELVITYPTLRNIHEFAIAVNEDYANDDLLIKENDVVAIIPPVSGG